MYRELYQYLVLHKHLDLPGIGSLLIERKPAQVDIADKIINPPAFHIVWQQNTSTPAKKFFTWLGSRLGISERDAVIRFNDFLFEFKKQLSSGNNLEWLGVGTFSKALGGDIHLESLWDNISPGMPVPARKVLRENAEHIIRVGEEERTSAQMMELLHHADEDRKRSLLWMAALVITILSVIFIGYYFSARGLNTSSAANQQKLVPQQETRTR